MAQKKKAVVKPSGLINSEFMFPGDTAEEKEERVKSETSLMAKQLREGLESKVGKAQARDVLVKVKTQEEVEEETQTTLMNDESFMDELSEAFGVLPKKERM